MRVAFIHPDLGLGGAERLVVDAALSLQELGHSTIICTPFQDANRTFREVTPPAPQVPVRVVPLPIPRSLFGRLQAILAALRCALLAVYVCLFVSFDVAFVDIVSLPLIVFAVFRKPVLFYCHYPDKLLATSLAPHSSPSRLKTYYRRFVDSLEAFSLRFASVIVCNSRFTACAFERTFSGLPKPSVIYPCVSIASKERGRATEEGITSNASKFSILSLNRYERKKDIGLAIDALAAMKHHEVRGKKLHLVIAGGYDERIRENIEYFNELEELTKTSGLTDSVTLLRNISDSERRKLLQESLAVLYTPSNEHFGIVPLEAMAEGIPVIAANSGGPTESIEDRVTGFLCDSTGKSFADAITLVMNDTALAAKMGTAGRERVLNLFARSVMGRELQNILMRIWPSGR